MSTLLKFQYGIQTLQFEYGGDYPAKRTQKLHQVKDRTASGELQSESLGIKIGRRVIRFNLMSITDYQALINWFLEVSNGAENEFVFTDEYGSSYNAKILEDELDFDEDSYQRFSGSITLEYKL